MDIFDYLKEEEELIQADLSDLVKNFPQKTRETVFDEVKLVCDKLRGHCKKQAVLLLDKIQTENGFAANLESTRRSKDKLLSELENLVMVHVDEPGYREYLANILHCAEDYFAVSRQLYAKLKGSLSNKQLEAINSDLRTVIHSDVGFNSLQTPKVQ
jgi:hypothetical protein